MLLHIFLSKKHDDNYPLQILDNSLSIYNSNILKFYKLIEETKRNNKNNHKLLHTDITTRKNFFLIILDNRLVRIYLTESNANDNSIKQISVIKAKAKAAANEYMR